MGPTARHSIRVAATCLACLTILIATVSAAEDGGRLIFHSGFEPDSVCVMPDAHGDITGIDRSVPPPNDWVKDLEEFPTIGAFKFYGAQGGAEDRTVRIIPDPTREGNHVLEFWMKHAKASAGAGRFKARIQANLYDNPDLTEYFKRVKIYFHPDIAKLKTLPDRITWYTLEELWCGPEWGEHPETPFRIGLHLHKAEGVGQELHFSAGAQQRTYLGSGQKSQGSQNKSIWGEVATDFPVPVGEWLTLETYYKMGDEKTGRFWVAVRRGDGPRQVLIDVTNWTYFPDSPTPVPLTHWNPLKMYTSDQIITHIRNEGGVSQIYWDDFELWTSWPPDMESPASADAVQAKKAMNLKVTASDWEQKAKGGFADFPPEKTLDGDLSNNSSWRAESHDGAGQWIQYDLGAVESLDSIRLAFTNGDSRRYRFKIETSADAAAWSIRFDGESSGKTKEFEAYDLGAVQARYVRVTGFGNTNAKFPHWININEVEALIQ
jgi:hypothetical protein